MRTIICAGIAAAGIAILSTSSAPASPASGRAIGEAANATDIVDQVRVRDCRRYRCKPYRSAHRYYRDPRVPLAPYGGWYSGHWDPKDRRGNLSDSIQDSYGAGGGGGGSVNSDIRLKHGVALLGRLDNGLGLYRFSYNGSDKAYVGVMAQEVETVAPDAVTRGQDGYLRVNYDRLGLRFQTWDEWVAAGRKMPHGAH